MIMMIVLRSQINLLCSNVQSKHTLQLTCRLVSSWSDKHVYHSNCCIVTTVAVKAVGGTTMTQRLRRDTVCMNILVIAEHYKHKINTYTIH